MEKLCGIIESKKKSLKNQETNSNEENYQKFKYNSQELSEINSYIKQCKSKIINYTYFFENKSILKAKEKNKHINNENKNKLNLEENQTFE